MNGIIIIIIIVNSLTLTLPVANLFFRWVVGLSLRFVFLEEVLMSRFAS